jgi:RNA polymerase sigma factor (sigma-70 family)
MAEYGKALVEQLFAHRGALQAFFYRRLRIKSDAADLVQEVYLRMLRVADPQAIRNPEAYLFTVAGNLLRENAVADRRQAQSAPVEDVVGAPQLTQLPGFETDVDTERRVARMCEVIEELSPKCCAAVVMQYRHELSYQEIAVHLGVSPRMVKKYLTQALNHFRKRMERLR